MQRFTSSKNRSSDHEVSTIRGCPLSRDAHYRRFWCKSFRVNCRAFHAASCGIFCFFNKKYLEIKIWNAKCGHLLWDTHYLLFTAFCMPLFFVFFQIYLKQFLGLVIYGFVENFKRYLLIIKGALITGIIEEKSLKYWEAYYFWDTRYLI